MKIQASIAGFTGQPTTLIANLDDSTGVLVIVKELKYREERAATDVALISNLDLPDLDMRFSDENLQTAIRSFFTRTAQHTLDVMTEAQRHNPATQIERGEVDESGQRYRIASTVTNGQMAVLAIVHMVEKSASFRSAVNMQDELADFYRVISI